MDWTECLYAGTDVATLKCVPIVFKNVINWALIFAGVVALFFVIYAGFQFVRSRGDAQAVEGARKTLTYAIIGLLFILFSFAIVNVIATVTGVDEITNPRF